MKTLKQKITTIDNTSGTRPNSDQVYSLTVEFHTGNRYAYFGKTKKEAIQRFNDKWGSFYGFVKKEWEIVTD